MDYKKDITHFIIKFMENNKYGKANIDLVPISWTYYVEGKLYCKYPKKKDYHKIDKMSKVSSIYGSLWKGYEVNVIKEVRNYNQGLRRMNRAFSDTLVHSSNVDDQCSSQEEDDPINLNDDDVQSEISTSSDSFLMTYKQKKPKNKSLRSIAFSCKNDDAIAVLESDINDNDGKIQFNLAQSSQKSTTKKKSMPITKPNHNKSLNIEKKKQCPTCGCTCATGMPPSETYVSKANLESVKRSLEYKITEEAKQTRHLFASHNNIGDINKIMQEENLDDMPKLNLEDFQQFDNELKNNLELIKKLKCFMLITIKSGDKLSESLKAVIPRIISKEVQLLYSAFGRETYGSKKLNFSGTQSYKYLLETITTKDPNLKLKDISSQLSRWFSGAKDREGGKKERIFKKMKHSLSREDKSD
ncbi:uncharacterized protein LOC111042754 [Myzus persicae]|uniref:uncharacterized protein LOC111042754 n=1 Tax=Myzus persicae TaxID=13164 RepID=UPI000B93352C|nr:uncharacterized protein LOC111042754 [Myzus persicae]